MTSNPAIFEKAITGSSDYRAVLEQPDVRALDASQLTSGSRFRIFATPPMPCAPCTTRRLGVTGT